MSIPISQEKKDEINRLTNLGIYTQTEIAAIIGISRDTVNRVVTKWDTGYVDIVDRAKRELEMNGRETYKER